MGVKKTKEIFIAVAVCIAVLAGLICLSVGLFKIFYDKNNKPIETMSENKIENKDDEILVKIDDSQPLDVIEEEEEKNEEEEKELTPEEKQKMEEERKKQEEERKKKEEEQRKIASQTYPYWVKVNYTANTVTVYGKDANGDFTVPVRAMVCSTGRATPHSGVYRTSDKYVWGTLIGPSYGQYCTRITGGILFHSVPYLKNGDKSTVEYWEYDRLGEARSLGCIRLTVEDAQWLFYNCPSGTSIEFYSSANPGPLGKPTARKISGYENLKGWDPTDPDPNNPWKNHDEEQKRAEEEKRAKEEAERLAREEAERLAKEEADRLAKEEADRLAKEEEEKKKQVTVEDVVGKDIETARRILSKLGLRYNEVNSTNYDSTETEGTVISQSPEGGMVVNKEKTIITLTINYKNIDQPSQPEDLPENQENDKNEQNNENNE